MLHLPYSLSFFFFNATPTSEIYTLSLHDALPIFAGADLLERLQEALLGLGLRVDGRRHRLGGADLDRPRSEEHTSELQSLRHLVCRLLLEKKNTCSRRIRLISRETT